MISVIKQDLDGNETWRYSGEVIDSQEGQITIEAFFDREDMLYHGMWLCKGDRFVETYFTDRWYNIFEIHDREDDRLKGWYCNIATPAVIDEQQISYKDLALDLLVLNNGKQIVLDEDEFIELDLAPQIRHQALRGMQELQNLFRDKVNGLKKNRYD
ncbi:MAG: DUF402 domain-containing protein [Anaerolineales bacterium]|nr:DUF402 domain-containing protein [Chloroflexota bacterium]MBL6980773.1 DUF402 domain-containing protein [Anaerolineales bacterium]